VKINLDQIITFVFKDRSNGGTAVNLVEGGFLCLTLDPQMPFRRS